MAPETPEENNLEGGLNVKCDHYSIAGYFQGSTNLLSISDVKEAILLYRGHLCDTLALKLYQGFVFRDFGLYAGKFFSNYIRIRVCQLYSMPCTTVRCFCTKKTK